MKKVVIAGATGMIGGLILDACLSSDNINEVISLVRKKSKRNHKKLFEVSIDDFTDYSNQTALFENVDAAFFCIGVYTGQVSKEDFITITVDYAIAFAKALKLKSPDANLCLLSGSGADRTETSKTDFAKYKGIAENKISALGLNFYSFRPAYIYPVSPRQEPNLMYQIIRKLYPLIRLFGDRFSIKSTQLASAMFKAAMNGTNKEILENQDIIKISEKS